uniref:Sm domain-containing protein n=1 Tax=Chelonoidis abingdonii TaxID=106734 RepID=A0A8C0IPS7_CHEAB
ILFYAFFKFLVGKDVVVELKNDLSICGALHSVDQYLNIILTLDSIVCYVQLQADKIDTQLLQDASHEEAMKQKQ